jgi:hypothetical protein
MAPSEVHENGLACEYVLFDACQTMVDDVLVEMPLVARTP